MESPPSAGFLLSKIKLASHTIPCRMADMKGNKPNHKRVIVMSYKDLEAEIKAWAGIEEHAKLKRLEAEETKRQDKRRKREAKLNAPLVPKAKVEVSKPVSYRKRVVLVVRCMVNRVWGEDYEIAYHVDAMSDTDAELQAIKLSKGVGLFWVSTVSIKLSN